MKQSNDTSSQEKKPFSERDLLEGLNEYTGHADLVVIPNEVELSANDQSATE